MYCSQDMHAHPQQQAELILQLTFTHRQAEQHLGSCSADEGLISVGLSDVAVLVQRQRVDEGQTRRGKVRRQPQAQKELHNGLHQTPLSPIVLPAS